MISPETPIGEALGGGRRFIRQRYGERTFRCGMFMFTQTLLIHSDALRHNIWRALRSPPLPLASSASLTKILTTVSCPKFCHLGGRLAVTGGQLFSWGYGRLSKSSEGSPSSFSSDGLASSGNYERWWRTRSKLTSLRHRFPRGCTTTIINKAPSLQLSGLLQRE